MTSKTGVGNGRGYGYGNGDGYGSGVVGHRIRHNVRAKPATKDDRPLGLGLSEGLGACSRSAQMGPLEYGNCQGLPMARNAANCARRDDLRGMYPSACVVLDMHVARLEHAIRGMLATWDDESDVSLHDRIAELRDVLTAPNE